MEIKMSDTAFQIQYRREFILGFEDMQSRLRGTTITETVIKGDTATFLVADSGSAEAVTRGVNGLIPARADNNTQLSATLVEWHDLVRKTKFNIFASQGDQNRLMQQTTMGVINRKIDNDIITQLDTATNDTGSATTASLELVINARTILGNNFVDTGDEDNLFACVTPAFMGYLMQVKEFASADYVDVKPLTGGKSMKYKRWAGFNWIEHPRLPGSPGAGGDGTSESCFFYHRNAIGHAVDKENMETPVGYDEEQDYSWSRATAFMGSKLLQQSGIVKVLHDGSSYAAQ
jgi:hypothetical protein